MGIERRVVFVNENNDISAGLSLGSFYQLCETHTVTEFFINRNRISFFVLFKLLSDRYWHILDSFVFYCRHIKFYDGILYPIFFIFRNFQPFEKFFFTLEICT